MKSITIAGNIGKDAETRQTQRGDAVTSFSVAVEERRGQDKRTIWFDVSLWGKRGDALRSYLTKGSKVAASGDLSTREHNGKTYLTVNASEVTLMGNGQRQQGFGGTTDHNAIGADNRGGPGGSLGDGLSDDIPFFMEWR